MFRLDVSHLQAPTIYIHSVEQDQPQGMKNRETTKYSKSY